MRVGAFLLHYRFWPGVRPALDALMAQTRRPDVVVVVDNGSGDGSAAHIAEAYPDVELVEVAQNRGAIAGLNHGMDAILARDVDVVVTLTHELVLAPDALERLVARLESDPSLGAVGPLVGFLSQPERVFSAGGTLDPRTWWVDHMGFGGDMATWQTSAPRPVDWLDGCCLVMRSAAARAAMPFFEGFYYFFDEADFFCRMRSYGWRVECVPGALAWQEAGAASPYVFVRNMLGLVARNGSRADLARMVAKVGYALVRSVPTLGDPTRRWEACAGARGLADFARNRWGRPPGELEERWKRELAGRPADQGGHGRGLFSSL